MCKISVIVPVYNTENYLHRCVDSLISQTLSDIEIILVDDGSIDNSPAICDEYASKDPRVKTFHKINAGQGLARNDGIKLAKGIYISFLDSDDYYDKKACEILVNAMDSSKADLCSYGYKIQDNSGNLIRRPNIRPREYTDISVKEEFILHYFGDSMTDDNLRGVSSCMSVFRRDIIVSNNIEFPSERVVSSEDTAFCLEYCKHIKKAITIDNVLYHYCQNDSSFSKGYRPDRFKLMKAHISLLNDYASEYNNWYTVKDRIAMTTWINLIAAFKQEYEHFSRSQAIKHYKEMASDEDIKNALKELPYKQLPAKQKLLYMAVRWRLYLLAYELVGVRVKRNVSLICKESQRRRL